MTEVLHVGHCDRWVVHPDHGHADDAHHGDDDDDYDDYDDVCNNGILIQ